MAMFPRLLAASLLAWIAFSAPLPTPEHFAGFRMGADKKLVRWDRIVEYMRMAASASKRIRVEDLGKTTNGNPMISVIITSPANMGSLDRYKQIQKRIAYPRHLEPNEAEKLIATHKAVVLITCNIHSTEIGSSQMVLELIHRLATEESPSINKVLDNVIFILVPSFNPDGQIIVTDWYNKNLGTEWEYSPIPELYHKFTGHDNNRDAFMNTQVESRMVNKLTYKDWFPVVFFDEHQMGSNGARIFVPPFKDPVNPNVDPMIWQWNGLLGYAMGAALHSKGYTGIVNDALYTSWWQGGFLMQAWWHNMVGLLTEVASAGVATPIEQEMARAGSAAGGPPDVATARDPRKPLPPPRDTIPRNTYPRPWLGGKWTLRNIVDYELAATYGFLDTVANHREGLIRNFYELNRKQIELGAKDKPYAWVIPATQHDPAAAIRLVQIMDEQGVEVHRAKAEFRAGRKSYPAGSYVILMSQPFRPFAKDMMERQTYPVQRAANGTIERPYDVTGWTLPLQMGVEAIEIAERFDASVEAVSPVLVTPGKFEPGPDNRVAWEISHNSNNSFIAVNRLIKAKANVAWNTDGSIVAYSPEDLAPRMKQWSRELGLDMKGLVYLPASLRKLRSPRTGLYRPSTGNMDEGWTRWLLEQYEFPYSSVHNNDLQAGQLRNKFDVILFADQPKDSIINGLRQDWVRPEHRGGIGKEGVDALREFVRAGGTLVMLGSASLVAIEEFPLPLKNSLKGLRPDQFSCPGSILKIFVDNRTPVGYGMQETASAVFYNDVAYDMAPAVGDASVKVIAKYPASGILESGWIGGEEFLQERIAAADVSYGKGRVVVLGFSPQNRAQPHGTFKLLFNSLHYSAAE